LKGIKKYKKQMNELKKEVENYDNLIIKKEQALKELK